jgi:hypothetical protein
VDEREQVVKNAIEEFTKRAKEYEQVINSPKTEEEYVGADLKAIVHHKKRKGDPAVPSLVSKLRERYEGTKGRPDLSLKEYLADQGYDGDNVDCVISEVKNEYRRIIEDGAVTL